jgi:hypothetical protein
MSTITVCWPANLLSPGSFSPPLLPGAPRGLSPITPNANAQSVVDPSVYPLQVLLDAGFTLAPPVGATSARPTSGLYPALFYFDSTLGIPIWRNAANTAWVNASGATV